VRFRDRRDAGAQLAERVRALGLERPVVLALPRGGVPVAAQVAGALDAPLDVFVSRKIGAPGHAEYGIGAIAEGGEPIFDRRAVAALHLGPEELAALAAPEREELARRVVRYRGERVLTDVRGRDVVLVDDGLATGVTAQAALVALRAMGPGRLVLAAPVCAQETATRLAALAEVVCAATPASFHAVGAWYDDFTQTSDDEVLELLREPSGRR
jgi:putative phosphoribosyl transferase